MNRRIIKVLLIEDNPNDARLTQMRLSSGGDIGWDLPIFDIVWVNTLSTGIAHLEAVETGERDAVDVVLTDLDLPDSQAGETFAELRQRFPDIPMVVLTGREDAELARTTVRAGAQDYLFKNEATGSLLAHALTYAIERQENARALQQAHAELEQRVATRTEELRQANEELKAEIAARKKTEAALAEQAYALRTSEGHLRRILEASKTVVFDQDKDFRYIKLYNPHPPFTEQSMLGKTDEESLPPDDAAHLTEIKRDVLASGTGRRADVRTTIDGEAFYYDLVVEPLYDQDDQIIGVTCAATDITARKQAAQALKRSEERFRGAFEQAAAGIAIAIPDETILDINEKFCEMLGYSKEELLGRAVSDITYSEDLEREYDYVQAVLAGTRNAFDIEKRYIHKQGHLVWVNLSSNVIRNEQGDIQFVIGVAVDITARKQAEEALQESESRYRSLFTHNHEVTLLIDPESGAIVDANPAACAYYGYSPEALNAHTIFEINTLPEARIREEMQRAQSRACQHFFFQHRLSSGEARDVEVYSGPIHVRGQELLYSIVHDITARKQAEAALQESLAHYDKLTAQIPVGVYICWIRADGSMDFEYVSNRWCDIHQVSHEAVLSDAAVANNLVHPEELEAFLSHNREAQRNRELFSWEGRFVIGGEIRWLRIQSAPEVMDNGDTRWFGVTQDITKRKRAEEALRESEERFREIYAESPIGIELYDANGELYDANRACLEIFGVSEVSTVKGFKLFADPNIPDGAKERLQQGKTVQYETLFDFEQVKSQSLYTTSRSGTIYLDVKITALGVGEEQPLSGYLVHVQDITQRRQAEERLRASERIVRAVIEASTDIIVFKDMDFVFRIANPAMCRFTGKREDEIVGKTDFDLLSPEPAKRYRADDQRVIETGEPLVQDERIIGVEGERWVSTVKSPVVDERGICIGIVGIVRDITARKQAEEKLQSYAGALQRSNAQFQEFATIVSHDLRAPLRMVKSFLGLLERHYADELDNEAKEYIQFAVDGAEQMKQLISALLSYAHIDSQGKDPEPVEAEEALEKILHTLQFRIEELGAEVTYDSLPTVLADPTQLGQLFQNLIENALKFRDEEAPRIHISAVPSPHSPSPAHPSTNAHSASAAHFSSAAGQASAALSPSPALQGKGPGDGGFCTGEGGGMWHFSVRDNGIGITPQHQGRLFQVFQRLHTRGKYEGTGIGLATCKKIVERHGGRIWVESEAGKGATFYFTLPGV